MGKLVCICDEILSDTCGSDAEAFVDEDEEMDCEYVNYYYRPGKGRSILECPKCGSLAIEDPKDSCYVKFYKPENGLYNKLFSNYT